MWYNKQSKDHFFVINCIWEINVFAITVIKTYPCLYSHCCCLHSQDMDQALCWKQKRGVKPLKKLTQVNVECVNTTHVLPRPPPASLAFKGHGLLMCAWKQLLYWVNQTHTQVIKWPDFVLTLYYSIAWAKVLDLLTWLSLSMGGREGGRGVSYVLHIWVDVLFFLSFGVGGRASDRVGMRLTRYCQYNVLFMFLLTFFCYFIAFFGLLKAANYY